LGEAAERHLVLHDDLVGLVVDELAGAASGGVDKVVEHLDDIGEGLRRSKELGRFNEFVVQV